MIKNLRPRLPEIGKIKIGCLGEKAKSKTGSTYRKPRKIDHFLITFPERGKDGNFIPDLPLMEKIGKMTGQDPNSLTSLPCYLLYDDMEPNLYTSYCCYRGRTKICQGDGKEAVTSTGEVRSCPCEKLEKGYKGPAICKPYCRLSVVLAGIERIGGVWVYRSCGWNTVQDLMGSFALVRRIAKGHIAGCPLSLNLVGRTATTPTGQLQKIYTAFLSYEGNMESLAQQNSFLSVVEDPIPIDTSITEEEAKEITEEFYPEEEPETVAENAAKSKSKPKGSKPKKEPSAAELAQVSQKKEKKKDSLPAKEATEESKKPTPPQKAQPQATVAPEPEKPDPQQGAIEGEAADFVKPGEEEISPDFGWV